MKNTTILLSLSILFSACSKTVKEIHNNPVMSKEEIQKLNSANDLAAIKKLLASEAPNLALAELLAQTVPQEQRQELKALVENLSVEEAQYLIREVQKQNSNIRKDYLFHGQKYQHNKLLLANIVDSDLSQNVNSIDEQLKVSVFSFVKNKTLAEIISTYDSRASKLTEELAEDIAYEIGSKNPRLAEDIERTITSGSKSKAVEMINNSKELVVKIDSYFKSSDLNENEQYATLLGAAVAGGIYLQVKDNAGFKKIVQKGLNIVRDAQELHSKAKEAALLICTLSEHLDATAKDVKDFSDGIKGSHEDFIKMYNEAKLGMGSKSNIHSKRIVDFLYQKVIRGKDVKDDGTNSSILSKQGKINANIEKSVNAVGNIADNLANIIATTNKFASLLGIKPSKDMQKILVKAQKVAEVVSTIKGVMVGYAAGGPLGAIAAFSSSSMMGSLMGGGSKDSAKLEEISRKLDIVIENQKKIISMQLETMKMIKDLALLIDKYHLEQMVALAELRNISLVTMEINKLQLNSDIRSCERMIDYQMKSVWDKFNFGTESFQSINHLRLIHSKFGESITSLSSVQRMLTSVEEKGVERCQTGISEAFSGNNSAENPIRAIFSSVENDDLTKFERETYQPLLTSLAYFSQATSLNSIPLHFPADNFEALKLKAPYLEYAKSEEVIGHEVYNLENLISVKALERYLSSLILLHPILEVDKNVWFDSVDNIVGTYLKNSNIGRNQNTRSGYFLSNALKLIQSAIAQEALLAGEPILQNLNRYNKEIFSNKKCTDEVQVSVPYTEDMPFLCAIRSNKLLMKNLVMFTLQHQMQQSSDFFLRYENAFKFNDLEALAKMLSIGLNAQDMKLEKNDETYEIVLKLNVFADRAEKVELIKLPRPGVLREGKILYSENMPRLILMQSLVLEQLEKVAPVNRKYGDKDLLGLLMVAR